MKKIVSSSNGEVRIEAEDSGEKTEFRTYILNNLERGFIHSDVSGKCNPQGIAAYYVTIVQQRIREILAGIPSTADQADNILFDLVADMQ